MTQQLTVTSADLAMEGASVASALRRRFGGLVAPIADGTDEQLAIPAAISLAGALEAAVAAGPVPSQWILAAAMAPDGEPGEPTHVEGGTGAITWYVPRGDVAVLDATRRALAGWLGDSTRRGGMAHPSRAQSKCPKIGDALEQLIEQL